VTEDMRTHVIDLLNLLEPAPRDHCTATIGSITSSSAWAAIAAIGWRDLDARPGVFDVAYFLSSGLNPADRRHRRWTRCASGTAS
jgi:hypothetical protein